MGWREEEGALWDLTSKIFMLLGNVCNRCGFDDERAFQIDHVQDDGRKHRGLNRYYYLRSIVLPSVRNNEGKFQILCANCNWIKRGEKMKRLKIRSY